MGKIILTILMMILGIILWALPLYLVGNLVLYLFHISFHLTLLQAISICMLIVVISNLLFGNEEDKNK